MTKHLKIASKTYNRLFLSYFLILLLPLVIIVICIIFYSSQFKKEVLQSSNIQIQNAMEFFDSNMSKINFMADEILISSSFSDLINNVNTEDLSDPRNGYSIWTLQKRIRYVTNWVDYLKGIFLYFPVQQHIISDCNSMPSRFFFTAFPMENSEALMAELHKPVSPRYFKSGEDLVIIASSLSSYTFHQDEKLVMILDPSELFSSMDTVNQRFDGFSLILSEDGMPVYCSKKDLNLSEINFQDSKNLTAAIGDRTYIYSVLSSDKNHWKYYSFVSREALLQSTWQMASVLVSLFLIVFLIGILAIRFISHHVFRPLRVLENYSEKKGNFRALEAAMEKFICDEEKIKNTLELQRPFIRRTLIYHLITNFYTDSSQLLQEMEAAEIDLAAPFYCGIIVKLESDSDIRRTDMLIQHTFPNLYIIRTDANTWSGIIKSETQDSNLFKESISATACRMQTVFKSIADCALSVFCGSITSDLLGCYLSYDEAKSLTETLSFQSFSTLPVCQFFDTNWQLPDNYFYSHTLEKGILEAVQAGNSEEIKKNLNYIYNDNFSVHQLSAEGLRLLACRMASTAIQCAESLAPIDKSLGDATLQRVANALRSSNPGSCFKEISFIIQTLSESVQRRHEVGLPIKSQLALYINQHFSSQDLCLDSVAEVFNITPNYLSVLFKEQVGQTFSEYLENARLNKAIELLVSAQMDIETVSAEVGYSNSRTFRRAFKRAYGMSPKEYAALKENFKT